MRQFRCSFFRSCRRTPNLRIGTCVAAIVLFISCDKLGLGGGESPTAPTRPPGPGSAITYTALGASDANGIGSSVPCVPFTDCPDGKGYVFVTVNQLKSQGFTVTIRNLGIPTAVIGRDFQTLGQQYGRTIEANLIEQEMPFVLTSSTLVTVFAGPNEVNTVTAALGAGAGDGNPTAYVDAQVRAFGADFSTLLTGIRARAGSPRIIVLNVPNLAGLPYLASASAGQRQAAQRAAVGMTTTVVNPLATQGVIVIDLMCDPRTYAASSYSGDGLHPNDAGYAFMAAAVVAAETSSAYPAPQASCPQMTFVPNP
jgi:lysophospholipase L1-like esterase